MEVVRTKSIPSEISRHGGREERELPSPSEKETWSIRKPNQTKTDQTKAILRFWEESKSKKREKYYPPPARPPLKKDNRKVEPFWIRKVCISTETHGLLVVWGLSWGGNSGKKKYRILMRNSLFCLSLYLAGPSFLVVVSWPGDLLTHWMLGFHLDSR